MQEWKKQAWKDQEYSAGVENARAITDGKPQEKKSMRYQRLEQGRGFVYAY